MRASSKIYKLQTDTHMIQKLTMELHGIPPPPKKKKIVVQYSNKD